MLFPLSALLLGRARLSFGVRQQTTSRYETAKIRARSSNHSPQRVFRLLVPSCIDRPGVWATDQPSTASPTLDGLHGRTCSNDLDQWTSGKRVFVTNSALDVAVSNTVGLSMQFFRARETSNDYFSNRFNIEGLRPRFMGLTSTQPPSPENRFWVLQIQSGGLGPLPRRLQWESVLLGKQTSTRTSAYTPVMRSQTCSGFRSLTSLAA